MGFDKYENLPASKCGRIERRWEDDTMCPSKRLAALLMADPVRWRSLGLVASLRPTGLLDRGGFVRDAVWDHLHFRASGPPCGDIDVVWFDPERADAAVDKALEAELRSLDTALDWSVRNQARMHIPMRPTFRPLMRCGTGQRPPRQWLCGGLDRTIVRLRLRSGWMTCSPWWSARHRDSAG
jgi:hypothetical protein